VVGRGAPILSKRLADGTGSGRKKTSHPEGFRPFAQEPQAENEEEEEPAVDGTEETLTGQSEEDPAPSEEPKERSGRPGREPGLSSN